MHVVNRLLDCKEIEVNVQDDVVCGNVFEFRHIPVFPNIIALVFLDVVCNTNFVLLVNNKKKKKKVARKDRTE